MVEMLIFFFLLFFAIFLHHSFLKISCRADLKLRLNSLETVEDSSFFLDLLHDWKALSV